ncbi:MAG TPA: G1 family glutamic endopeptidase [Chloroflexota bacterium]
MKPTRFELLTTKGLKVFGTGIAALLLAGCSAPAGLSSVLPPGVAAVLGQATGASSAEAAVQQVIQRANAEQQQALAQNNPELMQDTSTPAYYQQMAQAQAQMASSGITSIQLTNLTWGSVTVSGSTAQATTTETWRTILPDGTLDVSTNQNVYSLANTNGSWLIQSDTQPASTGAGGPPPAAPVQPRTPAPVPAQAAPGQGQSRNWSGYAATGGTFTSVTGTWTVPQPAAGSAGTDAAWVGIGGVQSRDLIQAGTQLVTTGAGDTQYSAWIETLPQASQTVPLTVAPGDSVTVSITQQTAGQWQVAMKDNTTGKAYSAPVQYTSSLSSAEWVEEAPTGGRSVLPLDQFGQVHFASGAAIEDGQTVNISQAGARPISMINSAGRVLATPSGLGNGGGSFSVTRSPAPNPVAGGTPAGAGAAS